MTEGSLQEAGSTSEQGSKEEVRLPQEEQEVEKPTILEESTSMKDIPVEQKLEELKKEEVITSEESKTEEFETKEVVEETPIDRKEEKNIEEKAELEAVEVLKSNGNIPKMEVHLTESDKANKPQVPTPDGDLQEVPLHTQADTQITISPENPDPENPKENGKVDATVPTPATSEPKEKISCVQVLNAMVFLAFMVNYMLRVNLTIAIVDMIQINETTDNSTTIDEPKFSWNTYQKNLILGCFFWGYVLTELPGGRMSEVFGPRRVYGYSMLIASLVTFFTPYAALNFDYMGVIVLRVIVGFMLGVTFPAMQPIASKWIPPKDRTKFVSNMMASSLGAAVTLPVCGYLISSYGWQSVFYVTGVLGTILAVSWFLFVYDTPSQHPRITREEREYLEKEIGASSKVRKAPKVPWGALLTSMPVWAIVVTHACSVFCYFTFLNQMPTYMKRVLGTDIKKNGILSSFPYIGKYAMALITSYIADYIRARGKLSTTLVRKCFTTFAVGLPGLLMVAQVYLGDSTFWTVSIFTFALTLNGAVTAGYLGNGLDIAPNYSGTIFGIANTFSSMGGFLSTYVVADITFQNETYERFQIVFWILAVTYFFGCLMYLLFGTGELLEWNSVEENKTRDVEMIEKQPLKNDTINEKL
ncbi:unnamed protein product [Nezara viridula]|uniref:Major facilitator superfamily (MFS) profile domain-containing protein n=1 Tax=Nezara viridula TaxID=85310 RepID=A0A9P0HD97_NEZVI|nr:unnamed protein product [Nezara viridula]